MTDNSLTLTAAELRRIGKGIANLPPQSKGNAIIRDLIAVHAALERLIDKVLKEGSPYWIDEEELDYFPTKDAAIDALLQGGGE